VRATLPDVAYRVLTPEERFRLILAAGGRNDDTELDRLAGTSPRVSRTLPDYYPYVEAFQELTHQAYLEALDFAGHFFESLYMADAHAGYEPRRAVGDRRPTGETRLLDTAFAAGYLLKTKAAGWTRFCDRLGVPPFLLWEALPGYDRVRRAVKAADGLAFDAKGFHRWRDGMHRKRGRDGADDAGPLREVTPEAETDRIEAMFWERVAWWGGPAGPSGRR
jgi:hypothetical protein